MYVATTKEVSRLARKAPAHIRPLSCQDSPLNGRNAAIKDVPVNRTANLTTLSKDDFFRCGI